MVRIRPIISNPVLQIMEDKVNYRTEWFNYVKKTRAWLTKAEKKPASHQRAMAEASKGWMQEKAKIERRHKRAQRKRLKEKPE